MHGVSSEGEVAIRCKPRRDDVIAFFESLSLCLLGSGAELSSSGESKIAKAIRERAQGTIADIGDEIVRRQLDVQPTLTIRPGFPIRIVVRRDLVLAPWNSMPSRSPSSVNTSSAESDHVAS